MSREEVPQRGNRSTGDVHQYTSLILRGYTLEKIGEAFGITGPAVRKALKRSGMPTCSRRILAAMPTGCTPTDAEVLRAANHALADENSMLRARIRAIKSAIKSIDDDEDE